MRDYRITRPRTSREYRTHEGALQMEDTVSSVPYCSLLEPRGHEEHGMEGLVGDRSREYRIEERTEKKGE